MTVERGHRAWQVHVEGHLDPASLATDLAAVATGGGGPVFVWVSEPTPDDDAVATAAGLSVGRDLFELRVRLPVEAPGTDVVVRPFRAGDEDAWVEVNNRAFAWHPEQGGWTGDMLRERLAEPWVDLDGFLVHERDGRLAGFCWTKVHADHEPPLGEIYVIAVDPDLHGLGLGRALTLAGLDWLHRRRGVDVGMLYVDGSNTAAMRLYEKLGFEPHHIDRAYAGDVPPTR
jgi:mycothiol synthase